MKLTLTLITLILLFNFALSLRSKHKTRTLNGETDHEGSLRKKIKNPVETNNTASTNSASGTGTSNVAAPAKTSTGAAAPAGGNSTATVVKKVDSSGAGPADVNAQLADATGIETNETSPPISRCTQSIGVDGTRIKDLYNFNVREAAHMKMNIWNVNVFEKKDPATLIASAEWTNVDFPVRNMTGAPECLYFQANAENDKKFAFCLAKEEDLDAWYDAILAFKLCRDGVTPSKGKKNCLNQGPNMVNYTDPLTGRTMQVEDQSSAARIGGGGRGGCVNCGK